MKHVLVYVIILFSIGVIGVQAQEIPVEDELYLLSPISLQLDKSEYYIGDMIFANGTMNDIDWSIDTTITYSILDPFGNPLVTDEYLTLNDDGTFNFTLYTSNNEFWNDYSGYVQITITFQNYTSSESFTYYNTPNISNEVLHDRISYLEEYMVLHLELHNEEPDETPDDTPLEAPKIIRLIADDPDDIDDIFSVGDTITIIFDSDTNMPGGNGTFKKPHVDNKFTFSDVLGSAYEGIWENPYTFVITMKNISNTLVVINSTTVTPALETLILSADETSGPSFTTSPVLIGDWGILE